MRWLDVGKRLHRARLVLLGLILVWLGVAALTFAGVVVPPSLLVLAPMVFVPSAVLLAARTPWSWAGIVAVLAAVLTVPVVGVAVLLVAHRSNEACTVNLDRPTDEAYILSHRAGVDLVRSRVACTYDVPDQQRPTLVRYIDLGELLRIG